MKNPFKFGTIVDGKFFTDRKLELQSIQRQMESENHLVLISPRRFGKSSLVLKSMEVIGRPYIFLNLQKVVSTADFAALILKEVFKLRPLEKIKHLMSHFRVIPTISTNPMTDTLDVTFQPTVNTMILLEDAMALLEKISTPEEKLIVILDEFQEIIELEKGIDKRLRAIMQEQTNINYIILGSQESMMTDIFEKKKSPFYHFGQLMYLKKIPREDFFDYLVKGLETVHEKSMCNDIASAILDITDCHPYYTQQLASQVWEILAYETDKEDVVNHAVQHLVEIHDLDFERLWLNFNRTDRYVVQTLCRGESLSTNPNLPTSTIYSSIKRLSRSGYLIKMDRYEVEDPFFRQWIKTRQM